MRRLIGTLAINWLRKPENQAKLKRGANEARRRFDEFRDRRTASRAQASTPERDRERQPQPQAPQTDQAPGDRND